MKKLAVLAVLFAGVSAAFSQGNVLFDNKAIINGGATAAPTAANGHADRLVYYTDNTALKGTNWVAQLYYNTGGNQAESSLHVISGDTFSAFRATTTLSPGTWAPPAANKVFPDAAIGSTVTLQVRVWDGSLYSTYASAADPLSSPAGPHITGKSVAFNFVAADPNTSTPSDLWMVGLQSFTVAPAPEPSTIALGLLGAVSLLVVRRRK